VNILEPQNFFDLPVAQRRLILTHLPRDLCVRTLLRQKFLGRHPLDSDRIISGIKHLEPQTTLLDGQITDLSQIPSIDITPCISFTGCRIGEVGGEISFVLMRLDDISNSESVDVILEASGESAGCLLAADLGKCVPRNELEKMVM
jgi:hypothetical protein